MSAARLSGWTPFSVAPFNGALGVAWCRLGSRRMVEPFFYETIFKAMTRPFNLVFHQQTPVDALALLPWGVKPAGFIFHMSRCGSTLLSQALAASPENIVVSEAAPLRTALDLSRFDPATAAPLFCGLVNAFAQRRFDEEKRLFIKFMAADVLYLPLISRLFPDTPWIFCYRDPVEILASQAKSAGIDLMAGMIEPGLLGLDGSPFGLDPIVYQAFVLSRFGRVALDNATPGKSLFLDYADLPDALWTKMPAHFGFTLDAAGEAAMRATTLRDAKAPGRAFTPDVQAKRATGAAWRDTVEKVAGDVMAELANYRA